MSPLEIVRGALQAYVDKDRPRIEALLDSAYRFTSPLDNGLDRDAYFRICWPNSATFESFDIVHGAETGGIAFVIYEATIAGQRMRNVEVHHARDGKLVQTEVYFGWNLPHPVPAGQHAEQP